MFYCKVLGDLYPGLPWILIIFSIFSDMTILNVRIISGPAHNGPLSGAGPRTVRAEYFLTTRIG